MKKPRKKWQGDEQDYGSLSEEGAGGDAAPAAVDLNGDGVVTVSELIDADGDGQVSAAERTAKGVPYWMEGDETMYTSASLKCRMKIRQHADVREVLERWWDAALRGVGEDPGSEASKDVMLTKFSYLDVNRKIYKVRGKELRGKR